MRVDLYFSFNSPLHLWLKREQINVQSEPKLMSRVTTDPNLDVSILWHPRSRLVLFIHLSLINSLFSFYYIIVYYCLFQTDKQLGKVSSHQYAQDTQSNICFFIFVQKQGVIETLFSRTNKQELHLKVAMIGGY